jgi:RNA 2',3'-cyclic 3'-phosphodiesterase
MLGSKVTQPGLFGIEPPTDGKVRHLFFALVPDESVIAQIEIAIAKIAKSNAAFGHKIKPHRQHMTLLYIDTFEIFPENAVRNAKAAADLVDFEAFDLTLDKVGSFPSGDVPWWLGCENAPANLAALHRKLVDGLHFARQKFRGGKAFVPHVSISRKNSDFLQPVSIAPIHWRVHEFCSIESVLNEPDYNVLMKWKLADV